MVGAVRVVEVIRVVEVVEFITHLMTMPQAAGKNIYSKRFEFHQSFLVPTS